MLQVMYRFLSRGKKESFGATCKDFTDASFDDGYRQ